MSVRKIRSDSGVPRAPKTTQRQDLMRYFLSLNRPAQEQFIADLRLLQDAQDFMTTAAATLPGEAQ